LLFYDGTDTIINLYQTENVNNFSIPISKQIGIIQVDPGNWVLNQVGSISVGTDENFTKNDFIIAPNPATEELKINFNAADQSTREISILSLSGSVLKKVNSDMMSVTLNIADLPSGNYICKVSSGKNQSFKKFVKAD
jgi:hypothetical protein